MSNLKGIKEHIYDDTINCQILLQQKVALFKENMSL